jgi:aryl-alcohol dehydrogenase-like predicted oxidoreductase
VRRGQVIAQLEPGDYLLRVQQSDAALAQARARLGLAPEGPDDRIHKKSAAQVCLRYLVQQGIVVIPRTSKLDRLVENAELFDFALSDEEMAEIAALARPDGRVVNYSYEGAPNWD